MQIIIQTQFLQTVNCNEQEITKVNCIFLFVCVANEKENRCGCVQWMQLKSGCKSRASFESDRCVSLLYQCEWKCASVETEKKISNTNK